MTSWTRNRSGDGRLARVQLRPERSPLLTLSVTEQAAEDLRAAAKLIQTKGWIQGAARTRAGYSIDGAIAAVVSYPDRRYLLARQAVRRYLGFGLSPTRREDGEGDADLVECDQRTLAEWNDQVGRTTDEAVGALLGAAEAELAELIQLAVAS